MKTVEATAPKTTEILFGKLVNDFHLAVDSTAAHADKFDQMISLLAAYNPRFLPRQN